MPPSLPSSISPEAVFRYLLVAQVRIRMASGQRRSVAIRTVSGQVHPTPDGGRRRVSRRTLQRWFAAWEAHGLSGLEPVERPALEGSHVIESNVLTFFREQKSADHRASVPELIRRAERLGLVPENAVDRVSVWRALVRMNVDTRRTCQPRERDVRPFAWPHRMQMVLCDGKHFRAGIQRHRRVAIFFLDDASRYGLDVVVRPSETSAAFLLALHRVIRTNGLMDNLYADHGSAFIALDSLAVISSLLINPIFGEVGYPPGRGGIEKFNQTAQEQVLRTMDGNSDVDPEPASLELRLCHWLREEYNHHPHEGLGGETPWQRWSRDERPLRFPESADALDDHFILPLERRVSNDNVVPIFGTDYQLPPGHAGRKVTIWRHLLQDRLFFVHDGQSLSLSPVDLAFNAVSGRARRPAPPDTDGTPLPPSAADLAWKRDMAPIVGPDGGFPKKDKE